MTSYAQLLGIDMQVMQKLVISGPKGGASECMIVHWGDGFMIVHRGGLRRHGDAGEG